MSGDQNLKSKIVKGSLWSLLETFSLQFVQLIVGIILARLLEPKDYGLIALAGIFAGISAAITDGGFEKILIKKIDLSSLEINTIFFFNVFLGLSMTLIMVACAQYISAFFNEPALTSILRVVSIGFFVNSLGQTQRTLLAKKLNFAKISRAQILSSLVGATVGISMAETGFGVWALVFSGLVPQVVRVVYFWIGSDWYPRLRFSYASIKDMIPYGMNILFGSIIFFTLQQFNNFIVGKVYHKTELGLFNRGSRFPDLVITLIESIILKMAFPMFSKLQDDPDKLMSAAKRNVKLIAFITFPILTLLLANAHDITIVLFTQKWSGSIIFLELFCIVRMIHPLIPIYRELLLIKGYAKLLSRILFCTSAFEIILVLLVIKYGVFYIIIASLISVFTQYIIYVNIISRKFHITSIEQIKWILPCVGLAIIMFIVSKSIIYLQDYFLNDAMLLKLAISLIIASVSYVIAAFLFRIDEIAVFKNVIGMILKKAGLV